MASISRWTNNPFSQVQPDIIDLTRAEEDEIEVDIEIDGEDNKDHAAEEAKALLDRFTKPKPKAGSSEWRPLKRKSPSDSPGQDQDQYVRDKDRDKDRIRTTNGAAKQSTPFGFGRKTNNGTHTHQTPSKPGQWPPTIAPVKVKQDEFKSVLGLVPQHHHHKSASPRPIISTSKSISAPSAGPVSQSESDEPMSVSMEKTAMCRSRSSSMFTDSDRSLFNNNNNIMVVVPPPPTPPAKVISRLHKRKIHRKIVSETEEESDPDEPKGVKSKYYPLEMYELQAERGRYPKARSTRAELQILPTRPAHVLPHKDRTRAPHSKKLYLRKLLEKKLRAIEGPPVTMARDWDGSGSLASNFEFTNKYKLQQGVNRVPEEFNGGCPCGVKCDPHQCQCLSQEEDSEERMVPYEHRHGKLLLSQSFLRKNAMIKECSSHCSCMQTCWNRLVQYGRSIRLEIFFTGNRGFGLRSPDFIHRGQFIDTYLGEVITSAEAEIRESASDGSQANPSYLFALDWFPLPDNDVADEEDHYVVDGQRFGGPTRFMNHSCNPNCKIFPVSTHLGDQRIYDLAFFARRDIPPGTELTFDYNPHWNGDMAADPHAVKCLCGETKCRGQLWPNQRKSSKLD